jgi:hypothetical protein
LSLVRIFIIAAAAVPVLNNLATHITRQLGYKHIFCQNVMSTKHCLSLYFCKKVTCLSVGLLMMCQVFSVRYEMCIGGLQEVAASWAIYIICVVAKKVPDVQCSFHI